MAVLASAKEDTPTQVNGSLNIIEAVDKEVQLGMAVTETDVEQRKWLAWTDDKLVHLLPANCWFGF